MAQNMVVSSYYIGKDERDSWIELLVTGDNVDARNWRLGDYAPNGGGHLQNFKSISFRNVTIWQHLRRGTIIVLYCRNVDSYSIPYNSDLSPDDGYLEVNAMDTSIFSNVPLLFDTKLNFHPTNEKVHILDATGTDVHSLGHGTNHSNFLMARNPKVVNLGPASLDLQIQVCPGGSIAEYDNVKEDTIKTNTTKINLTLGLPNQRLGNTVSNTQFWNSMREPQWLLPTLTVAPNATRTHDTLVWNTCVDPYTADSTQGYLVLRSTTGIFSASPTDGTTYTNGDVIGNATVVGVINSSLATSMVTSRSNLCNATYYRVYAFRYSTDEANGNSFHVSRGRAYNQTTYASGSSTRMNPVPILYHY